jgi:hypothetical protein
MVNCCVIFEAFVVFKIPHVIWIMTLCYCIVDGYKVAEKLFVSVLLIVVVSTLGVFETSISTCWITKLCHKPETFATNYSFHISLSVPIVEKCERFEVYYLQHAVLFCKCSCLERFFKLICGFLVRWKLYMCPSGRGTCM